MTEERAEGRQMARPLRIAGRFVRRSWQGIVVGVLVVVLGIAAYLSPGLVQADVHLDEGMVYAVKRDIGMVGMVNVQIDEVVDGAPVGDTEVEILQHEDLVLIHGVESDHLSQYFPGRNAVSPPTQLPPNAELQLVGDTLLVVNPNIGAVWFGPAEQVLDYDFDKEKAHLEVGENGTATLTSSGDVIGLNTVESQLVRLGESGPVATDLPFEFVSDLPDVEISAVGDEAVVLDRSGSRVWAEGLSAPFEAPGVNQTFLMEPAPDPLGGEEGAHAIYSNAATLVALTSDGPRALAGSMDADPVRPIQVGDCVYAAFGDQFVKRCRGEEPQVQTIPQLQEGADLEFEVNRATVSLNDAANGYVWLVDKNMTLITDWDRVVQVEEDATGPTDPTVDSTLPDREKNTRPTAVDDDLMARAGRSTTLHVLDNDNDPDGDVLTISVNAQPSGASLQPVRGGAGLQITVAPDAPSVINFSYTISDGRGESDSANVTVTVLPQDPNESNEAPHLFRQSVVKISQRQTLTKRVLLDWRDREGDPMFLKSATAEAGTDDFVRFTSDGTITFRDDGKRLGRKTVAIVVSDGVDEREGELVFDVTEEIQPPVAYGDFVTGTVGKTVTVNPILNDLGDRLALAAATSDCADCQLVMSTRDDTVKFTSDRAGIFYVRYTVTNGNVADGLIRIDIMDEATDNPPIPALDVAYLPAGGTVMIDPLLNDTDADGDVLVLQGISSHPALEVILERRHLVTIRAKVTPSEPITLSYRVSDGKHVASDCTVVEPGSVPCGTIIVIPTPPTDGLVTPEAEDDNLRVRAGATGVADVLVNDTSPLGLDLEITDILDSPFDDRAWIDDGQIRVSIPAGAGAGTSSLVYEVTDTEGRTANARLNVDIVSEDAQNAPPVPRDVVDRVLAGTETRIPINLADIDPNGDAVRLIGLASGPTRGRVTEVGEDYLMYEAYEVNQGTDTFNYRVIDALGEDAVGEIRIGVAPANPDNASPTGVTDVVTVRPGRHVQFAPIDNDFDIDGDRIDFAEEDAVVVDEDAGIVPELIEGREIALTAPMEPGSYTGRYYVVDSRGASGSGAFEIVVDENAPLQAPVVRDDTVPLSVIADEDWPEVDVLANDYDPDGPVEQISLEVPPTSEDPNTSARVSADGRKVTVPVADQMQQVRYIAVDGDGNRSIGLIVVPGRNDSVPVLRESTQALTVYAGQPITFALADHVDGTNGRDVKLTSGDNISATFGSAKPAGPASIEYVPQADYSGPASVVFEVADVFDEGETWDKRAFISLPFTVLPAPNSRNEGSEQEIVRTNQAPIMQVANPVLSVGPAEGVARMDLKPLFKDPEGQQFFIEEGSFEDLGGDAGIRAWIEGSRLMAEAEITATSGSSRTIRAVVVDASGASRPFEVRVVATASTRPVITTKADIIPDASAGSELTIDVTSNDVSHLDDKTISLLPQVTLLSGDATVRANPQSNTVTVTPASGRHGVVRARYVVVDATGDPGRQVEGLIEVTVMAQPAEPTQPYDVVPGDSTITFKYDLAHTGGYPESEVSVQAFATSSAGEKQGTCYGKACTVTGLQNGIPWTVHVVVTNPQGSATSPTSAGVTPDSRPNPPIFNPTIGYADSQLTVSWQPNGWENATYGGSPILGYYLTAYDMTTGSKVPHQGADRVALAAGQTSFTWPGLKNGTNYQFEVTAYSDFAESNPSQRSAIEYPSGPPIGQVNPSVTPMQDNIGGGFTVSFPASAINNNGAAITEYWVQPVFDGGDKGSMVQARLDGGTVTATAQNLGIRGTRFLVFAKNRSSEGGAPTHVGTSNPSKTAYPLPQMNSVVPTVGEGQVTLAVSSNLDGHPVTYQYRLDGGSWQELASSRTITGLVNGRSYTIDVRAVIAELPASDPVQLPNVRPRTANPVGPSVDQLSYRFLNDDSFVITVPLPTWESTGGWNPDNYSFCIGPTSGCRQYQADPTFIRGHGQEYNYSWQYLDSDTHHAQSSRRLNLPTIQTPTYRGRDGLTFAFPLAPAGMTCVSIETGTERALKTFTHSGTGTFAETGADLSYTVTDPETGEQSTVTPDRVTTTCTAGDWSKSYR